MPMFIDAELDDPKRGAMTRALEYILQKFLESDDYTKLMFEQKKRFQLLEKYLTKKERELLQHVFS